RSEVDRVPGPVAARARAVERPLDAALPLSLRLHAEVLRVRRDGVALRALRAGIALRPLRALRTRIALRPLRALRTGVALVALITLVALRALRALRPRIALRPLRTGIALVALVALVAFRALRALRARLPRRTVRAVCALGAVVARRAVADGDRPRGRLDRPAALHAGRRRIVRLRGHGGDVEHTVGARGALRTRRACRAGRAGRARVALLTLDPLQPLHTLRAGRAGCARRALRPRRALRAGGSLRALDARGGLAALRRAHRDEPLAALTPVRLRRANATGLVVQTEADLALVGLLLALREVGPGRRRNADRGEQRRRSDERNPQCQVPHQSIPPVIACHSSVRTQRRSAPARAVVGFLCAPGEADGGTGGELTRERQVLALHDGEHRVAARGRMVGPEHDRQPGRGHLDRAGDEPLREQLAALEPPERRPLQADADAVRGRSDTPRGRRQDLERRRREPVVARPRDDAQHGLCRVRLEGKALQRRSDGVVAEREDVSVPERTRAQARE